MADGRVTLRGGVSMPVVGLGLWKSEKGEAIPAVRAALENGVRLLDGAAGYGNERDVGEAVKQAVADSIVKREDVFLVSKLFNTNHVWGDDRFRVKEAMDKTLSDLGVDYLDLYLMHWPFAFEQTDLKALGGLRLEDGTPNPKLVMKLEFLDTWAEMVKLLEAGKARAIGVCNFTQSQLAQLIEAFPKNAPSVNQCEIHPYLTQASLKSFCDQHQIAMMAYSPLGSGDSYSGRSFPAEGNGPFESPDAGSTLLSNKLVGKIAGKLEKSPAQVLIRWSVQRGFICIPKSVKPGRIRENCDVLSWSLSEEDMATLDGLNCDFRYGIGYQAGHYDCPNAPWFSKI